MEACHHPDRPYLNWICTPQFPDGRNNWEEFIDASRKIYTYLTRIHSGTNTANALTDNQEILLLDTFRSINNEDIENRTLEWINLIHNNNFKFADFPCENDVADTNDKTINYAMGFITADDNFSSQFYSALDAHYNWVKENLKCNNLDILTDTNILDNPV